MIFAIDANGHKIEDPFTDETGRFQVSPQEYYGFTDNEVDTFLFHIWFEETKGKSLSEERTEWLRQYGRQVTNKTLYKLRKEYEKEWHNARKEWGLTK